jgi:hypothetical protein
MGVFGVSAWDINVNTKLTDIAASNLHYSCRINDSGDFGFDVNIADPVARATGQVLMALNGTPFKVLITANNDQTILYSGIAWQTDRKPSKGIFPVGGKALMSYFTELTIANSYTTSVSPGQLIANVVNDAQMIGPGANRGITPVLLGLNTPPNVTPSYNKNQYTTVGQVISDQTAATTPGTGGVDYYMSDYFANGVPAHQLNIISPRAGRDQTQSGLSVNLMQAIDWDWPTEATGTGNHVIAVGGGTGGAQPVATADDPLARGGLGQMPLLHVVVQYSQVTNQSQLQTIANGTVAQIGKPISTPSVTIPADYAPCQLGAFQIGDDVKIWSAPSIWFPNGLAEWWRIVAYDVKVPDQGVPSVTLTLNHPPVF